MSGGNSTSTSPVNGLRPVNTPESRPPAVAPDQTKPSTTSKSPGDWCPERACLEVHRLLPVSAE